MTRIGLKNFRPVAGAIIVSLLVSLAPIQMASATAPSTEDRITALEVSNNNSGSLELLPAFNPNIDEYFLNVGLTSGDLHLDLGLPPGAGVSNVHICGSWLSTVSSQNASTYSLTISTITGSTCDDSTHRVGFIEILVMSDAAGQDPNGVPRRIKINIYWPTGSGNAVSTQYLTSPDHGTIAGSSGQTRFHQISSGSALTNPGHVLTGWTSNSAHYDLGEIIFLDAAIVFEPEWSLLESYVDFSIAGQPQDFDRQQDELSFLTSSSDLASVSFEVVTSYSYRVTLIDKSQQVVSRFSNVGNPSPPNLNATVTSLQAPSSCQGVNPVSCDSTFSIVVEAWSVNPSDGVSSSFSIMRPTVSGEVCLTVANMASPSSGAEELECQDNPDWFEIWFSELESLQDEALVWVNSQSGATYYATNLIRDPSDPHSQTFEFFEQIPLFSSQTMHVNWKLEPAPAITSLAIFGANYELVSCNRVVDDVSETVECLRNVNNHQQQYFPYGPDDESYFIGQTYESNTISFSVSNSSSVNYRLKALSPSLQQTTLIEDFPAAQATYSIALSGPDLCPQNICSVMHILSVTIDSQESILAKTVEVHIARQTQNAPLLDATFTLSGGIGADTLSISVDPAWVMPPDLSNATKNNFYPAGWRFSTGSASLSYALGMPVPILFDNQVIEIDWRPAFTFTFLDGFADDPVAKHVFKQTPTQQWGRRAVATATHPEGRAFLGWTDVQGSSTPVSFSGTLDVLADRIFYPIWSAPVAPAPSSEPANQNPINSGLTDPASSSSSATSADVDKQKSTKTTSFVFERIAGVSEVVFGLPVKYLGGSATLEVKRWINNKVRYFLIAKSLVQSSAVSGSSVISFKFKFQLKPTDIIRIKVGKVQVFKKRLGETDR